MYLYPFRCGSLLLLLLFTLPSHSQTLDDVFDDGVAARAANHIKTDLIAAYRGELQLSYERLFANQHAGAELGLGVGLGDYRSNPLSDWLNDLEYDLTQGELTNSFLLRLNLYYKTASERGSRIFLSYKNTGFSFDDGNDPFRVRDYTLGAAYRLRLFRGLYVDGLYEVGFRHYNDEAKNVLLPDPDRWPAWDIIFSSGLQLVYLF